MTKNKPYSQPIPSTVVIFPTLPSKISTKKEIKPTKMMKVMKFSKILMKLMPLTKSYAKSRTNKSIKRK